MKKTLFLVLFLTLLATIAVWATNEDHASYPYSITGIVVDEDNKPMPGASVLVVGTTVGAGTNAEGVFRIQLRSNNPVKLRISFTGYESVELMASPLSKERLQIRLIPSDNQLNDVIVTGTRIEKPLKEVPVITRVISHKDIETLNPANMESLLQYELPGLQIVYNSMSQLPEIKYQGMEGEYMLFLVDGERVSGEGSDHNVDFSRFNVDDIERIEVIKGAQSTVYGSNALGGVINIITKSANRPFTGNINARYAGNNGQKYTLSAGTKQNRFSSLTNITYRTRDTYTIGDSKGKTVTIVTPEGTIQKTAERYTTTIYGYRIWDASQKFGYAFSDKLNMEIKGTFYHNKRDIRKGKVFQDFFMDYTGSGKLTYIIDPRQQLKVSYVYDEYKKNKDYFEAGFTRTDYKNLNHIAHVDYAGTFGKHTVSAGLEANFEYLKHYMFKDSADNKTQYHAVYAQEDWKVTDRLSLITGVRSDYHKKYHWHITPKLSAMYRPTDILTIRVGYSQGFRSPTLKELYECYDRGGRGWLMIYGNEHLKPETSNQYTLSGELTLGSFNFSVSAAHNRFKDKIALKLIGDGSSDVRYENADKAKTTSIESIVRWKSGYGLVLTGSYAYVDDYEEIEGKNTSYVRPHAVTFSALYAHKFGKIGANLSVNGQWASALDCYTFREKEKKYELRHYDARTICTLNAGVQLPRGVNLSLGIDNLFNYKDKSSDSVLQLPQKGTSYVATVNINLADMFNL